MDIPPIACEIIQLLALRYKIAVLVWPLLVLTPIGAQQNTPPLLPQLPNTRQNSSMTAPNDPNTPSQLTDIRPQTILADIQDFTDSIDQAGLYVLLQRLTAPPALDKNTITIEPIEVYTHPSLYRGRLLHFDNVVLDQSLIPIRLSRFTQSQLTLYYVTAQIPFKKKQKMPAILIFSTLPPTSPLDQIAVNGYFYMILRSPTQEINPQKGPTKLDFLVLIVEQIIPQPPPTGPQLPTSWTNKTFLTPLLLLPLAAIWIILRRKTHNYSRYRKMTP